MRAPRWNNKETRSRNEGGTNRKIKKTIKSSSVLFISTDTDSNACFALWRGSCFSSPTTAKSPGHSACLRSLRGDRHCDIFYSLSASGFCFFLGIPGHSHVVTGMNWIGRWGSAWLCVLCSMRWAIVLDKDYLKLHNLAWVAFCFGF